MTDYWFARTVDQLTSDPMLKSPSGKTGGKPADDFQKILERSSGEAKPESKPGSKSESKTEFKPAGSKTETKPQEAEAASASQETAPGTEDMKTLENQMALAAMAVMQQNPAVVTPEEQAPQEAEAAVLALAPVDPENAAETPVQTQTVIPAGEETSRTLPEEGAVSTEGMVHQEAGAEAPVETEQAPQTVETERESPEMTVSAAKGGEETAAQDTGKDETPVDAPVETPVFENVRDIPVKVGEAPAEEPEPEIPVEDQIGPKLAQALNAGDTRVELQLEPENLGRVTVEMTFAENGSLHVTLHAESGKTLNLLEKGLDNLHLMLARNTQQDVRVEVQKQEESQQQNFYDGRGGHAQHHDQRRERREERRESEHFFQQLRLGLISEDGQ